MMKGLAVLAILLAAGCASSGQPPVQAARTTPAPAHPDGDLTQIASVEGMVYRVDGRELLLRGQRASALRFAVPKGQAVDKLHRGDHVRVHIRYVPQGMEVSSVDLLAPATKPDLERLDHWPDPHQAYMHNPHLTQRVKGGESHP